MLEELRQQPDIQAARQTVAGPGCVGFGTRVKTQSGPKSTHCGRSLMAVDMPISAGTSWAMGVNAKDYKVQSQVVAGSCD